MDNNFSNLGFVDKCFVVLVCFFILTIPLNNSFEVFAMLLGRLEWKAWSTPLTPIYIKLIKDFFILSALFLLFLKLLKRQWIFGVVFFGKNFFFLNVFVFIFLMVTATSIGDVPDDLIVYGVRGYWVVLLVYVGAFFYNVGERYIERYVLIVFFVHFALQVVQTILGSGYAVFAEFRSPGMFIIPATAGAFSLFVYYLAEKSRDKFVMVLAVISLLLSTSTMGLMVFLTYIFMRMLISLRGNFSFQLAIVFIFSCFAFLFFINLDVLSGRGDAVYVSMFTRFEYIFDVLADFSELTWGLGMGIATSQAVLSDMNFAVVADNTFTGAILNIGWVGAFLLFVFVIGSYFVFNSTLLFLIFVGYSMTTVIFEISPVIHLLMLVYGMHAMNKNIKLSGG